MGAGESQVSALHRWGGPGLVVAGILVLATLPLIPLIIPSLAPTSTQSGIVALQSEGGIYTLTWVLYLVSDLLYLVAFFVLYRILKLQSKSTATIAVVFNTVFVAIDVAVDIPLRLWLVVLSSNYTSSSNPEQLLSSATFAITTSNLVAVVATFFQFAALIMVGYLMTRSPSFGSRMGYLGVVTGIVALLFIPAFLTGSQLSGLFNLAGFALLGIWSIWAGLRLRKMNQPQPAMSSSP